MKKSLNLSSISLILLFVFFAVGFYTSYNAKGTSYLSSASESRNNCHIMNEVHNEYMAGSHAQKVKGKTRATCVDCHLPHGLLAKWIAKAENGLNHAYVSTFKFDEFPTNLSATEKNRNMIQGNYIRCHADFAQTAINATTNPHVDKSLEYASRHQDVGHKHRT